ncbi:MAG: hypothetical protein ABIT38_13085 [Gemmatimonadaceae bacterium]
MSGRVGVELTPTRLRAVVLSAWRSRVVRTADVPWNPQEPKEGVRVLREALGRGVDPESISLAVGIAQLKVARVQLPPAPDETREQMLAVDPARYFATTDAVVVALATGSDCAFALDAALADAWCSAFAEWGVVDRCEAVPCAVARALPVSTRGTFELASDEANSERGLLELREGRVAAARRVPRDISVEDTTPLPSHDGVAPEFLAALGAARGGDSSPTGTLASASRRMAFRARATRRLLTAGVATAAAMAFSVLAFDQWRERTLVALESEASRLGVSARPALDAQARLVALTREQSTLDVVSARRADPAEALAAISGALPREAVLLSARAIGDEWRLDGTSNNAAAMVPAFDRDGRFESVRSLSASSRFQDGARMRETFSIALRVHPKP